MDLIILEIMTENIANAPNAQFFYPPKSGVQHFFIGRTAQFLLHLK